MGADRASIGRRIGNWEIARLLGEGAFGAVYLARHLTVSTKRAAIKILHRQHTKDGSLVRRFFNEALAASKIDHEHIVQIWDAGWDDGDAYLIMELLDGTTLTQLLEDGPLTLERTAAIGAQIADALSAAHEGAVVHRDLKPDNVFVTRKRNAEFVKVLDFGVAKLRDGAGTATGTGAVIGTPAYMSPEQCKGLPTIDGQADVYSLGLVLWRCLTGALPWSPTTSHGWLVANISEPVPDLRALVAVPPRVRELITRMLAKQASDRPPVATVVSTLREALAAPPAPAPRGNRTEAATAAPGDVTLPPGGEPAAEAWVTEETGPVARTVAEPAPEPPPTRIQVKPGLSPARLVVVTSNFAGREFVLEQPSTVIGRTDDNDIVLEHPSISRHHAKIVREGGDYHVVDLQSANGVRVNGEEYGKVSCARATTSIWVTCGCGSSHRVRTSSSSATPRSSTSVRRSARSRWRRSSWPCWWWQWAVSRCSGSRAIPRRAAAARRRAATARRSRWSTSRSTRRSRRWTGQRRSRRRTGASGWIPAPSRCARRGRRRRASRRARGCTRSSRRRRRRTIPTARWRRSRTSPSSRCTARRRRGTTRRSSRSTRRSTSPRRRSSAPPGSAMRRAGMQKIAKKCGASAPPPPKVSRPKAERTEKARPTAAVTVRAPLEAPKPVEAAPPPPPPSPKVEEGPSADALVADAQLHYIHGNYDRAIEVARKAIAAGAGEKGWRIVGASACFRRDRDEAIKAWNRVGPQGRGFLGYVCDRNGIKLK